MEGYQRRPPGAARAATATSAARETLNEAGAFLRRLIPFPGAEVAVASFAAADACAEWRALHVESTRQRHGRHRRRAGGVDRVAGGVDPR